MKEEKIVPSLLAADFWCLEKQIRKIEESEVRMLHFDIMDGNFVPNISMGFPVVETLRPYTKLLFDMHLMVKNPERYTKKGGRSSGKERDHDTGHGEQAHSGTDRQLQKAQGCSLCPRLNRP